MFFGIVSAVVGVVGLVVLRKMKMEHADEREVARVKLVETENKLWHARVILRNGKRAEAGDEAFCFLNSGLSFSEWEKEKKSLNTHISEHLAKGEKKNIINNHALAESIRAGNTHTSFEEALKLLDADENNVKEGNSNELLTEERE